MKFEEMNNTLEIFAETLLLLYSLFSLAAIVEHFMIRKIILIIQ